MRKVLNVSKYLLSKINTVFFILIICMAWQSGKNHEKWIICGDIDFYYGGNGKDGDLVKIRECTEKNIFDF